MATWDVNDQPDYSQHLSQEQLIAEFKRVWDYADTIYNELLTKEGAYAQPIQLRNQYIFYKGHMPGFSNIQLQTKFMNNKSFNQEFDTLFERGRDPDVNCPTKCHSHSEIPDIWPAMDKIDEYIVECRKRLLKVLTSNDYAKYHSAFMLCIEHDLMHQETLLYMYQQLDGKYKKKPTSIPKLITDTVPLDDKRVVKIPGAKLRLGADRDSMPWGWDNEYGKLEVTVDTVYMESQNITVAEFWKFVTSGAYADKTNWAEPDFAWKEKTEIKFPKSWVLKDGKYYVNTLFGELVEAETCRWPVFCSLAEATAYCTWKGGRIMSEAEYNRAAYTAPDEAKPRLHPWGNEKPTSEHCNIGLTNWAPTPVGTHPKGASAWGIHDLVGDAFEWTSTAFNGFPGFVKQETYHGYSADFFSGKHFVIKGK